MTNPLRESLFVALLTLAFGSSTAAAEPDCKREFDPAVDRVVDVCSGILAGMRSGSWPSPDVARTCRDAAETFDELEGVCIKQLGKLQRDHQRWMEFVLAKGVAVSLAKQEEEEAKAAQAKHRQACNDEKKVHLDALATCLPADCGDVLIQVAEHCKECPDSKYYGKVCTTTATAEAQARAKLYVAHRAATGSAPAGDPIALLLSQPFCEADGVNHCVGFPGWDASLEEWQAAALSIDHLTFTTTPVRYEVSSRGVHPKSVGQPRAYAPCNAEEQRMVRHGYRQDCTNYIPVEGRTGAAQPSGLDAALKDFLRPFSGTVPGAGLVLDGCQLDEAGDDSSALRILSCNGQVLSLTSTRTVGGQDVAWVRHQVVNRAYPVETTIDANSVKAEIGATHVSWGAMSRFSDRTAVVRSLVNREGLKAVMADMLAEGRASWVADKVAEHSMSSEAELLDYQMFLANQAMDRGASLDAIGSKLDEARFVAGRDDPRITELRGRVDRLRAEREQARIERILAQRQAEQAQRQANAEYRAAMQKRSQCAHACGQAWGCGMRCLDIASRLGTTLEEQTLQYTLCSVEYCSNAPVCSQECADLLVGQLAR